MLNTILYNWKEETNEVNKRKGNISTATPSAAIIPRPSISNNVSAVSSSDTLFEMILAEEWIDEGLILRVFTKTSYNISLYNLNY